MNTTARIQTEIDALLAECRSLLLATVNANGEPHASYTPFIRDPDDSLLILVSGLARHSHHLIDTGMASAMAVEDEAVTRQIYARRRLTFTCTAAEIPRDDADWSSLVDRFEARFGELIATLRGLTDFTLIRLVPREAIYVKGFGQAWSLTGPDLGTITHLRSDPRA